MLFGLRIKKLKWKIKMNEKTLKLLLNKLNIHLNDLDLCHLYAYLSVVDIEGAITNSEDVKKGSLVFKSLNGL